jgi:hypothetical protein
VTRRGGAILLTASLLLLGSAPAAPLAARGEDPDWPCVQRLVPHLTAGGLWAGPSLPEGDAWRAAPEAAALVARITPRAVEEAEGLRAIEAFAAPLDAATRRRLLPLVFAGALAETDRQRAALIEQIKSFARRQRSLAEATNRIAAELDTVPSGAAAAERRAELEQRHFFAAKAFQDAERTMRYVCEAPVRLEARLGAYARALQAVLPQD